MKFAVHKIFVRSGLIALAAFACSVPALAQFEIAPDHFDSNTKNEGTRQAAAKRNAKDGHAKVSPTADSWTAVASAKVGRTGATAHAASAATKTAKREVDKSGTVPKGTQVSRRQKARGTTNVAAAVRH